MTSRRLVALLASLVVLSGSRARSAKADPAEPAPQAPTRSSELQPTNPMRLADAQATEPATPPLPPEPATQAAAGPPAATKALVVTALGYVEAHYAYNTNRPSNRITAYRGFDNRHNTFTLSNVALGGSAEYGPLSGRAILQIGATPSSYYAAEPMLSGGGAAGATGPEVWKYLH